MGYYQLKNIDDFPKLKDASISRIAKNHYIMHFTLKRFCGTDNYISKSFLGAKMIFSREFGKGGKWEFISTEGITTNTK